MNELVIFCKSYSKDVYRAKRMAKSVDLFNKDGLLLYLSVPAKDLELFRKEFKDIPCTLLTDEEILENCYSAHGMPPKLFPRHLLQQLIKMEFWRMGVCKHYLWIDSDAYFLKPFYLTDFFSDDHLPLLIMHNAVELRAFSAQYDKKIAQNLDEMIDHIQGLFGRKGTAYYFGDPPLIWSCSVLESLYTDFLNAKNMSIYELLYKYRCEMQIYGEYCLASKPESVVQTEPFFKVYHYLEQFCQAQRDGESEYSLSQNYLGVIMQSNWTNLKEKKKNDFARFKKFLREQQRKMGFLKW